MFWVKNVGTIPQPTGYTQINCPYYLRALLTGFSPTPVPFHINPPAWLIKIFQSSTVISVRRKLQNDILLLK